MQQTAAHGALKIASYVVVALIAVAILYAGYISFAHWDGIGV